MKKQPWAYTEEITIKSPQTIVDAVIEILNAHDIENLKDEDPASFHHSTGRWMRNRWSLWDTESNLHKEFNSIGIFHADDMSGILLESAHRIINDMPADLCGQVSYYKAYWSKIGCDMRGNKIKPDLCTCQSAMLIGKCTCGGSGFGGEKVEINLTRDSDYDR